MNNRNRTLIWMFLLVPVFASACGKKGPPQPPLPHIPQIPAAVGIRQIGSHVYLWFDPPPANVDGSQPARIKWIALFPDPPPQPLRLQNADQSWRRRDVTQHPLLDRWFIPWTPPGPGCYRLALFNHRRKTAGPSQAFCYPQDLPETPTLMADLEAREEGVRISGNAANVPVEIYRMTVSSTALKPTDPVLNWPWQPVTVLPATSESWTWTDPNVRDGATYLYALRPRIYQQDSVWISAAGKVLGPLTYVDTFAPPPPATLEARPDATGWNLQWSPVLAPDWGGYRIYVRSDTHPRWTPWQEEPYPFTRLHVERTELKQRGFLLAQTAWIEFEIHTLDNKKPPNESENGPRIRLPLTPRVEDNRP